MTYTAKFFGGPAHGHVRAVADDMQHIVMYSWVDPIMTYEEWQELATRTKKTRYIRLYTLVDLYGTPHIGYFFPEDEDKEFINGMMNMEFADKFPLALDREEKLND